MKSLSTLILSLALSLTAAVASAQSYPQTFSDEVKTVSIVANGEMHPLRVEDRVSFFALASYKDMANKGAVDALVMWTVKCSGESVMHKSTITELHFLKTGDTAKTHTSDDAVASHMRSTPFAKSNLKLENDVGTYMCGLVK